MSSEFKDSGTRSEFGTGAVRDGAIDKGRMDLMPYRAMLYVSRLMGITYRLHDFNLMIGDDEHCHCGIKWMFCFTNDGNLLYLLKSCAHFLLALHGGGEHRSSPTGWKNVDTFEKVTRLPDVLAAPAMTNRLHWDSIEAVSKVMETGARKYAARNWEMGIPVYRYCDSCLRHAWKWQARMSDEPHLGMAAWNALCCLDTIIRNSAGELPHDVYDGMMWWGGGEFEVPVPLLTDEAVISIGGTDFVESFVEAHPEYFDMASLEVAADDECGQCNFPQSACELCDSNPDK